MRRICHCVLALPVVLALSATACFGLQLAYDYAYVRDKVDPSIIRQIPCETDYIPNVVEAENGAASFEALKAQAVAARTYLYYRLNSDVAVYDGTQDQVYSNAWAPLSQHYAAAQATEREILQYPTSSGLITICGFYVSGAIPDDTTGTAPFGVAEVPPDYDPHGVEKYVTYNYYNSGESIIQTSLGWRTSPPSRNAYNRGCKSQNGADFLSDRGWNYVDILRFYYGADVRLVVAATPASGTKAAPKTLTNFELDEGYFNRNPDFSASSQNLLFGLGGSTAERISGVAHGGLASQAIVLRYDYTSGQEFFYRHVSGTGPMGIATPVSNLAFEPIGSAGFWLLTNTPGLQVSLAINDDLGGDRGVRKNVVADGQWHFYQWFLSNPAEWDPWAGGDGVVSGLASIDSIQFFGRSDAIVYLDDVIYNPQAIPQTTLAGDITGDGRVNVFDLQRLGASWNKQQGQPGYDPACDLNADNKVNVFDLQIMGTNWNKSI